MKIKNKYKIGGHWFDIRHIKESDGFTKTGSGHSWNNQITIQADMVQSKKESVLFHEALHEMNWQHGWKLEEGLIEGIAESLYQFLVDNELLK